MNSEGPAQGGTKFGAAWKHGVETTCESRRQAREDFQRIVDEGGLDFDLLAALDAER